MVSHPAHLRIVHLRDLDTLIEGQVIPLESSRFVIGRAPSSELCLDDPRISRQHTEITWEFERFWIADCGSINGTFVNGARLDAGVRRLLKNEDEIAISPLLVAKFADAGATVEERMPPRVLRGLTLDEQRLDVFIGMRRLEPPLPRLPYRLLRTLYVADGEVVGLDALIEVLWPEAARNGIAPAMLDNQVARLRKRLARNDPTHDYIERIRNKGLRFVQRPG